MVLIHTAQPPNPRESLFYHFIRVPIFTKVCRLNVDVQATNDVRLKLRTREMVFTKLLLEVDLRYEFLDARFIRKRAQ